MDSNELVPVGDVTLFVRRLGSGKGKRPLLVLHGGPSWDHSYLLPGLEPLAKHQEVIAIDMRGCGRSSRDLPIEAYQPGHVVADTDALITRLGLDEVDLLGFSVGGQVAQLFVAAHPGRVQRLVLASTTAYPDMSRYLDGWTDYERRLASIPEEPPDLDDLAWTRFHAYSGAPTSIWDLSRLEEYRRLLDEVEFSGDWLKPWRTGLLNPWRPPDPEKTLRGWCRPVLILHGDKDMGFPVEVATRLHEAVPDSRLAVIPEAGHMAQFEKPVQWAGHITQFLAVG